MAKSICSVVEDGVQCRGQIVAGGYCGKHYQRARKYGDPTFRPPKRQRAPTGPKPPLVCSVDGCDKSTLAKGLCGTHYALLRRNGAPERQRVPTPEERFWAKVDKNGPVPEFRPGLGNCWIWTGAIYTVTGYGQFEGTTAHRWHWVHAHGPIPREMPVDHLCRVRSCVRLSHLEAVTVAVNLQRGAGPGGVLHVPPTHCPQNHPYDDPINAYVDSTGTPRCRICERDRRSARKERKNGEDS